MKTTEAREVRKPARGMPMRHGRRRADRKFPTEIPRCLDCGFEFDEPPFDLEACPECGGDIWQE
ncbi:MAG: hypothetical protein GTN86_08175 [Xanthomonadales bacterium]|nr:hypothetical protein [Xanthomonadales bacterium]NIN59846.1 hypothetical protein [Xanthomonadales bacterium]NIN75220.1 hypothetical protein [Xanthomonadales bacterium]NIO13462.1 hypothetical protein [Xanthomonadales bacterium]NIP12239.1 hypothetical protein [Xanthomonadales bacterium]